LGSLSRASDNEIFVGLDKNEATTVGERPFKIGSALWIQPADLEIAPHQREKIGRGLRDRFHHAEAARDHRCGEGNGRESLALLEISRGYQRPNKSVNGPISRAAGILRACGAQRARRMMEYDAVWTRRKRAAVTEEFAAGWHR